MRSDENRKRPIDLPIEKDEGVRVLGHRDGRGKHVCLPGGGFIHHWLFFEAFHNANDGEILRRGPVEIRVTAIEAGSKDKNPVYDVTMRVTIKMNSGKISRHVFEPQVCREIVRRLHQLQRNMGAYAIQPQRKYPAAPPKDAAAA